jgi:outer membrane protein insertion porin family
MRQRTILFISLLIFFSGLAPRQLAAQQIIKDTLEVMDYEHPSEYVIADVTVSGIEYIQKEVLVSLSGLKKGETITLPGEEVTSVLKKFWSQGLFSDAMITAREIRNDSVWIDIYLTERPRMSVLNINGIGKSETQDILEKINLKRGQQVTDDIMDNTKRIIREHFIEKGFLNTQVGITLVDDTIRVNMVEMNILVDKMKRVKIDEIYFNGVSSFKSRLLRRQMKDTKKVNINIFKASKLVAETYKEDKKNLVAFYNENGYRDAKVLSDSVAFVEGSDKLLNLYINMEEGDKYYFGDVTWVGNTKFPSELLDHQLGIEKGDIFDQSILDERLFIDEDAVNAVYLDNGYLFFQLTPVEVSVEDDTIDFEMRIYEGDIATINKVIISGNDRTNEHVVRRELRTLPGDKFSKSELIRTVRELANLGHFDPEQIEPNPIPNQADGTVDIEYKLVERATDQLEVSGGYGGGMLVGTIGIRFSNFAASRLFQPKAWRPVPSGDGQTFSLRAQTNGRIYQSYNFSFVEPWFGGKKPNSFSVSGYYSKMNRNPYAFYYGGSKDAVKDEYYSVIGASIGLGKRLTWPDDFFTLYTALSYQRYKVKDYPGLFLVDNGFFNNFSATVTLGRSSQDQIIYPRRGSNISLSLQLTPPYSLFNSDVDYATLEDDEKYKWVEYHRWMLKADWFHSLLGDLVLMARLQFGYLAHYNDAIGPSPFEGFDVGGDGLSGYNLYGRETIAQRGYPNRSLTPTDANGNKSGNVYTKYTLELRYPVSLNPSATIFGLVFLEGGNAWYSIDQFTPFNAKRAAGVGVRAFLPMFGMLGIDWAWGFDSYPGSDGISGSQFHFTIGQQF